MKRRKRLPKTVAGCHKQIRKLQKEIRAWQGAAAKALFQGR